MPPDRLDITFIHVDTGRPRNTGSDARCPEGTHVTRFDIKFHSGGDDMGLTGINFYCGPAFTPVIASANHAAGGWVGQSNNCSGGYNTVKAQFYETLVVRHPLET